jgi:MFS family permease
MRWVGLVTLCFVGLLGVLSYQLFSVLLQPIQAALKLTDTTTGLVNGFGIATVGALAAFPIGWAADRYGRRMMLGASVVTWSAFAIVMGLAGTPAMFMVGAVGINLGDAALIPLLYGIVATSYSGKDRDIANACMVIALTVGGSAVIAVGGLLLRAFGDGVLFDLAPWRAVCVAVAIAGFCVVPLLLTVPKGNAVVPHVSHQSIDPPLPYGGFIDFMRHHGVTISITFIGITFYFIAFYTFIFWVPALLERKFGLTTSEASIALGTPLILSSIIAIAVANIGLRMAQSRWQERTPVRMVMVGCAIAIVPTFCVPYAPTPTMFVLAFALMNLGVTISLSMAPALLQNCAPDAYRSRTIAMFPTVALALRILFPALVPWLSEEMGGEPQTLLNINALLFLFCLVASIITLWMIEQRYAKLAKEVAEA